MSKRKARGVFEGVGYAASSVMENPIGKRAVWTGVAVGAGLLLIGGVAFAATKGGNKKGGGGPNAPPQFGIIDENSALAACGGGWSWTIPPDAILNLITPGCPNNCSFPDHTTYAFYQDQLWKFAVGNAMAYAKCTNVNVAKLRAASGYSP